MRDTERAILEAAFEYYGALQAWNHGCPSGEMMAKSRSALIEAISVHADENDGELRISED